MSDRAPIFADCPLCANSTSRASWFPDVDFNGCRFRFLECSSCKSLHCDPMPDAEMLRAMYGIGYATSSDVVFESGDTAHSSWVGSFLQGRIGTFLDYGCGAEGALLTRASRSGWQAIGVEFDADVVRHVQARTRTTCLTVDELSTAHDGIADIVHVGDVLEHLTELDRQLPSILRLLKPGGVLLAQGPLEANWCLFLAGVRLQRRLRPGVVAAPPYHVTLATARGQRALFDRFALAEVQFLIDEVAWPAPPNLDGAVLRDRRALALYLLRKGSRLLSRLRPARWGNRYRYAGRLTGT